MEDDEIARYLASLEREDCYRIDATLKESPHELTQRVFFTGANGAEQGPFVRKFIHRDSGMGSAYERIFAAQQAGQRFKHIPAIHECYRHGELLVVVMEFVAGETLQDLIYHRDPSEELAAEVFPALCDAASELHEAFDPPLIHRDLKPSNIMLVDDTATVIDFGIAREYREGADTDTTQFGTRAFAPPEQFGFGQTTVRSDVYALGMLLYFCLTEKIPTAQVRDARFETASVPPHLRPILAHATDLDPSERFASAADLKAAFLEAMSQGQAEAQRRGKPEPEAGSGVGPRPREKSVAAVAIATACIVAALAALIALVMLRPANIADSGQTATQNQGQGNESSSTETGNVAAEQEAAANMQTSAPARNGFDPETNLEATIAGVTFQIPRYFDARIDETENRTLYYAETGSSCAMIMTGETFTRADADEDGVADDIQDAMDDFLVGLIQSDADLFSDIVSYADCKIAGHTARIVTIRGTLQELPNTTKVVYFINENMDVGSYVFGLVMFGQTDNAQFDYSADFAKTIASSAPTS